MNNRLSRYSAGVVIAGLLALPACNPFGKKQETVPVASTSADVLVTINGKPALTVQEFEQYEEQIFQSNPQLRSMLLVMPEVEKNLFDALLSQELLWEDFVNQGRDQQAAFKQELEQNVRMIKRGLATRDFQKENTVTVSDAEVKKYYDANKETIYLMAPAGVQAMMVVFDKESEARAFLNKAKDADADFNKLAQDAKLSVRSLGRINDQSPYVEDAVKNAVLGVKKFPAAVMVKTEDGKYAVVYAKGKEDAKYYPFDQAKEDAKMRLYNDKMGQMLNETLARLKKEYNVVENDEYFAKKAAERAAAASRNAQQATMAQADAEADTSHEMQVA